MSRAWVDQIRKPKLLYSPQPLKWTRLKNLPKHPLNLLSLNIEFY